MNFLLFLAILLHLISGLLFCGLPLIAFVEVIKVRKIGVAVTRESLLHTLGFGIASLVLGTLMAAAQWDSSFDGAWEFLGKRWVFLFAEFAFSMVLIGICLALLAGDTISRKQRWWACGLLFVAATNSLYHFPSLMVLTREFRRNPDFFAEQLSMAHYIFSADIFSRWVHIAIAAVMFSAVWHRLVSSWFFHNKSVQLHRLALEQQTDEKTTVIANDDIVELRLIDWRGGLWAITSIVLLWISGLYLFFMLPSMQLGQLTALTSGKSNQLMIGVVLATFVGVRCVANSTRPNRGMRVLDVVLIVVTIASMIDAVERSS